MEIGQIIVDTANTYVGQLEKKGNSGFYDSDFEEQMIAVGWQYGWAWCALFTELVWRVAYSTQNSVIGGKLEKLFSPSAIQTLKNFSNSLDFVVSTTPVKGSIGIYQTYKQGKPHWSGHAVIVKKFDTHRDGKVIYTIEGNANSQGGREGIEVANLVRPLDFTEKQNGLVLKGFIIPPQP